MRKAHGHPITLTHDGETYDFSHLHPTRLTFNLLGGMRIEAECRFKSHCYTRSLEEGERSAGLTRLDDEQGNERYFCPDRHALSLKLVGWISVWRDHKCIQGNNYEHGVENWIIVEDEQGVAVKVAFSIDKHDALDQGLLLWIKTTHPYDKSKPHEATRDNSFPFNTLAKTVAFTGKQPKPKVKTGHRRR